MLEFLKAHDGVALLYGGLWGGILASFFACCQKRWQNGVSLWHVSYCDHCQARLAIWQKIPIFSYLITYFFLKASCLLCQRKVQKEHFFNELFSTFMGSLIFTAHFPNLAYWSLTDAGLKLTLSAIIIWLTTEDFFTYSVSVIAIICFFLCNAWLALIFFNFSIFSFFAERWIAIAAINAFFLLLYFLFKNKMGLGDIIVIAIVVLPFDFLQMWLVLLCTSFWGLLYGLYLFILERGSTKYQKIKIPFIPFLVLSFAFVLSYGDKVVHFLMNYSLE